MLWARFDVLLRSGTSDGDETGARRVFSWDLPLAK